MEIKARAGKAVVCISGSMSSGKTTIAKRLASKMGLSYISGGEMLKGIAKDKGYNVQGPSWWETKEGLRFINERVRDLTIDREVDIRLLDIAKDGYVVIDSWIMPWLLDGGCKIWLTASEEERVNRLAKRMGISIDEASNVLKVKEKLSFSIYQQLYRLTPGQDLSVFHLVLDTTKIDVESVLEIVYKVAKKYVQF